jgi:methylmalonyl-CoA mutase
MMALQERTENFKNRNGRRPRILLTCMEKDADARVMKVIAIVYSDAGFDVDISPVCIRPDVVAGMAVDNDVHVVGVYSPRSDHKIQVADLIRELEEKGADDIKVILVHGHLMEQIPGRNKDFEILAARSLGDTLKVIGA